MNLNKEKFEKAVARGFALCAELKKDYPELTLYPVLSRFGHRSGQCGLTGKPLSIVRDFPEMMMDSSNAMRLAQLLLEHKYAKKFKLPIVPSDLKEVQLLKKYILKTNRSLYNSDVTIEFRTGVLKYEPLRRLQQDSCLTPGLNTVGNIRVISSSLEDLSKPMK